MGVGWASGWETARGGEWLRVGRRNSEGLLAEGVGIGRWGGGGKIGKHSGALRFFGSFPGEKGRSGESREKHRAAVRRLSAGCWGIFRLLL